MVIDSTNWVLFQPNIVIDAKLGYLWHVHLKLESLCTLIKDRVLLVDFLLQRTDSKMVLLNVLKSMMITPPKCTSFTDIELIFDKLNAVYEYVNKNMKLSF